MTLLPTNWENNIGMTVDADFLNQLGALVNASSLGVPRVGTVASSATPTIDTDNYSQFNITAQATAITSMSSGLVGTPADGQELVVRITDNGGSRAITWGDKWRGVNVSLPTSTSATGVLYVRAAYNAADSVWDVLEVRRQFVPAAVKGSASAQASSIALPAHVPGDVIVLYVYNNAASTVPTAPAASGTVPAWSAIDSNTSTSGEGGGTWYFTATANNHTSGTWTNATSIVAVVIRGAATSPLGGHSITVSGTSTTQSTSASITQSSTSGYSVLLYFFGHKTVTTWGAVPAGLTKLTSQATTGGVVAYSKNDTTSDGAVTQTLTASTAGVGLPAVVEILSAA